MGDEVGVVPVRNAPFGEALLALGRRRSDVVVLSADLSNYTDVAPFRDAFPERFIQVGMAEQNMMGIAGGLARAGLLPIAVTYGVFATRRAFDQVAMALCTGGVKAIVVAFLPGITTPFRATHQATEDLALMRELPGMTVIDPADATEMAAAVDAAAECAGSVYLRGLRGAVEQRFDPEGFTFRIGSARLVREGRDAAVIGTGLATTWALDAADMAEREHGRSVAVLHVPTIKPFDTVAVLDLAARFPVLHVVENHFVVGGLASAVSEAVAQAGVTTLVRPMGVPDAWAPAGSLAHIREELGLSSRAIAESLLQAQEWS